MIGPENPRKNLTGCHVIRGNLGIKTTTLTALFMNIDVTLAAMMVVVYPNK